jgi:DNA-binding NtrC family response regulator
MQIRPTILVIDSETEPLPEVFNQAQIDYQHSTFSPDKIEELPSYLTNNPIDILFVDLDCTDNKTGAHLLKNIHRNFNELLTIAVIPDGNSELMHTVLECNVFFYLKKPFEMQELIIALNRAHDKLSLSKTQPLPPPQKKKIDFHGIIGQTDVMLKLFDLIAKIAEDDYSTVLIRGESGTGKELVAKAIHSHSKRCKNNFVPVNCAAIPDDLLESELFGHTKGAFTGATQNKQGRIQYADGGTLFLDEIGDMKPSLQAKLLRVLQEKEFEPVGALQATPVDTRILAATHCDLEQLVNEGTFREDLYYRLSVIPLTIPPLKERKNDIPLLLNNFITRYTEQRGKERLTFSNKVLSLLLNYEWRGNVRELENLVQHMSILYNGKTVEILDLPEKFHDIEFQESDFDLTQQIQTAQPLENETPLNEQAVDVSQLQWETGQVDFKEIINDFETQLIVQAMKMTKGNKKEAAKILNLKRTTLLEKIKKKELNNLWDD